MESALARTWGADTPSCLHRGTAWGTILPTEDRFCCYAGKD
jgi:hypothetical protein